MTSPALEGPAHKLVSSVGPATGSRRQRLLWRLQAAGLRAFWRLCAALPPERASAFGRSLMTRIGPRLSIQARVRRNLRSAFPERSEADRKVLERGVWGNFGQVLAEFPHLETICWREADTRLEVVVHDESAAWYRREKPAIFLTAHLGNWELCAATAVAQGGPLAVVYSPQHNPLVDAMIQARRGALGCKMISKDAGIRALIRDLESGLSIGMLADHRVDSGELVPFFGHPARTTLAPARLALKFDLELVPMCVERLPGHRFRVAFHEAVRPRDDAGSRHEQVLDMTRRINALFEFWIRRQPDQWHCIKRRWLKQYGTRPPSGQAAPATDGPSETGRSAP